MYTIVELCLLCLTNKKNLKSILSQDRDGVLVEEKLKFFLLEFVNIEPDIIKHICLRCMENLNHACNFKQRCLRNILQLNSYIKTLKPPGEPCRTLQVTLLDIKNLKVNQVNSENESSIEPIRTEIFDLENVIVKRDPTENDTRLGLDNILQDTYVGKTKVIEEIITQNNLQREYANLFDSVGNNNAEEENVIIKKEVDIVIDNTSVLQDEHIQKTEISEEISRREDNVVETEHENSLNNVENNKAQEENVIKGEGESMIVNDELKYEIVDEIVKEESEDKYYDEIDLKLEPEDYSEDTLQNEITNNTVSDEGLLTATGVVILNIKNGVVQIQLEKTMHAQTYHSTLFANENETMTGIITEDMIHTKDGHSCEFTSPLHCSYQFTFISKTKTCEITSNICVKPGVYEGRVCNVQNKKIIMATLKSKHEIPSDQINNTELTPLATTATQSSSSKFGKKRHFCIFCNKLIFAIGRHVLTQHRNENRVRIINEMPKNSTERKKALYLLRCEGMYKYNQIARMNDSELIVIRNPNKSINKRYLPCPSCKGTFLPKNLSRHERQCSGREPNRTRVISQSYKLANPTELPTVEEKLLERLLNDLNKDEISEVVSSDRAILLLGRHIALKYARHPHQTTPSRQKLRELGRFLLEMRKIDNKITDLISCLHPNKYDTCKKAIQNLCVLKDNLTYSKPSLACHLRASLIEIIDVLKIQNIKTGLNKSQHQKDLNDFLTVHLKEYNIHINRNASTTLVENKWNKQSMLPSVEDIKCFQTYLISKAQHSYNNLQQKFKYLHWYTLTKCTTLLLLTFNGRRVGEVSRILIENFNNRQKISNDQYKTLSKLECILADQYERMEIRGKRGRTVPVLLNKTHIQYINMIIKYRMQAGVDITNPYLFGVPHKTPYILAVNVIRDYSAKCGASEPRKLRGTYLRKQVATISQMLNLNDNEIQQLADFMGHEVELHRAHYRKPELMFQVTRLAKFFMAAGDTDISKYKGKTLEELCVLGEKDNSVSDNSDEDSDNEDKTLEDPTTSASSLLVAETNNEMEVQDYSSTKDVCDLPESESTPIKFKDNRFKQQVQVNLVDVCKTNLNRKNISEIRSNNSPTGKNSKEFRSPIKIHDRSEFESSIHRKKRWSDKEINLIKERFGANLKNHDLPPINSCRNLIHKHPDVFIDRTKHQLYAWINNYNKKSLRLIK